MRNRLIWTAEQKRKMFELFENNYDYCHISNELEIPINKVKKALYNHNARKEKIINIHTRFTKRNINGKSS